MKTNNLLTYLLYALLGLLIIAAGYKACQMQEEKKRRAEDEADLEKMLRDQGYTSPDSTTIESSYTGDSVTSTSGTASTTSNGIEDDNTTSGTSTAKTTTTKPVATTPKPVTSTTTTTAAPKPAAGTTTSAKGAAAMKGAGTGRWAVRAGTFGQMEGARRRLEEVIRLGYTNAEISKTSNGQAAVVVFRSNDKNAAIQVMDKLEEKGVDAAVFDRKN